MSLSTAGKTSGEANENEEQSEHGAGPEQPGVEHGGRPEPEPAD